MRPDYRPRHDRHAPGVWRSLALPNLVRISILFLVYGATVGLALAMLATLALLLHA